MMNHTNPSTSKATKGLSMLLGLVVLGSSLSTMSGCRGDRTDKPPRRFFPDMDYQPKLKAQSETEFFVDGMSNRDLVEGTIPFGTTTHDTSGLENTEWANKIVADRARMLKGDESLYFGIVAGTADAETPQYVDRMPMQITKELIAEGQEQFNIYCSMCHGYDGLGGQSGTVGRLWSIAPANITGDPRFTDRSQPTAKDGYLFHIVREGLYTDDGLIRMPSYKHAVNEEEAWAIVAYLRVLQASQNVDPSTVDQSLLGERPAPPATETATDGGEG
jgi:mono/diheme cytochrome c family protein